MKKEQFIQKGLNLVDQGLNKFNSTGLFANSSTKIEEHRKALQLIREGNTILRTILKGIN